MRENNKFYQYIRDWALIISMFGGVLSYLIFVNVPALHAYSDAANGMVAFLQPALIFCMLLLTFCKIDLSGIHLCRWHIWLLLIQGGLFTAIALILIFMPHSGLRIVLEGTMICLICPTATAAPVITRKLGGNITHITTYTILINLLASILIPALLPYVHPEPGMSSLNASMLILGKVFPLLLFPLGLALLIRGFLPGLHRWLIKYQDAPFYLWMVSLALAMAVTARSITHSTVSVYTELWLVAASLLCCMAQFYFGRKIGAVYGDKVTAGQALGQKNTVLAIWMGYTFFTPITSVAGGFYSIWHNVVNSYQLYRHHRRDQGAEVRVQRTAGR